MFNTVWKCAIIILSVSNVGLADSKLSEKFYFNEVSMNGSFPFHNHSLIGTVESGDVYNGEYLWNKSISPLKYHLNICPHVCLHDSRVDFIISNHSVEIKCYPCDCLKPQCLIYGTCCPEVYLKPQNDSDNDLELVDLSCVFNKTFEDGDRKILTCGQSEMISIKYVLVSSCPDDFWNSTVKDFCQRNLYGPDLRFSDEFLNVRTRVSDLKTGVAYKNIYCAECNNIAHILNWKILIKCEHYLYVYKSIRPSQLLELSLISNSTCQVLDQNPDNNSSFLLCDVNNSWFDAPIAKCNVTALWSEYDHDVERFCHIMPGYTFMVKKDGFYYANIFCAICNSRTYPLITDNESFEGADSPGFKPALPFTMLLNFHDSGFGNENNPVGCSKGQWAGPRNRCFPIDCTKGKILDNDTCITALPEIRGLGYRMKQAYKFSDNIGNISSTDLIMFISNVIKGLERWYSNNIQQVVQECEFQFNITFGSALPVTVTNGFKETEIYFPSYLSLESHCISYKDKTRDESESNLIEKLSNENITFVIDNSTVDLVYMSCYINSTTDFNCNMLYKTCWKSEDVNFREEHLYNPMWEYKKDFLLLQVLFTCPYVRFDKYNHRVTTLVTQGYPSIITLIIQDISVVIDDINLTFSDKSELSRMSFEDDGSINICVDILNTKLEEYYKQQEENPSKVYLSLYVITLVCLVVSMVCLVLTLITYIRFKTLRSVAGINNMFLSATLLLSQAFLLTASHLKAPSSLCTVIGVCTHYMWLCMFSWCFLCCFHMYTIFTAKNRNTYDLTHLRKQLLKKTAFGFLAPAAIVVIVIVVEHFTSGGHRMGYGQRTCYLDSMKLIATSMVTPLAIVLISNTFFFASSVVEIYKVKKLQSSDMIKKSDRNNLYIYIKLSTVTGCFWILLLLAEGFNSNPVRYGAVIMNGLQGLFIFISYVCNKRVWNLYMKRLMDDQTKDRGTLSQIASDVQAQHEKM